MSAATESPIQRALATRDFGPEPDTATDEAPPAEAPAPDEATPDAAPPTGRDERGRFAPKASAAPAEAPPDEAPPAEAQPHDAVVPPEATPPPAADEPDPRDSELARLKRQVASYDGNLDQVRKEVAEQTRREVAAEADQRATQRARATIREELQDAVNRGDLSLDAAQARLNEHAARWSAEDLAAREQGLARREAEAQMAALGGFAQDVTGRLWERATPLMAREHGLPVEEVRAFWEAPAERERYQRAALQMQLARARPDLAANAKALDDYLETANTAFAHVARVRREAAAEVAALRKENDALRLALNRADAGDSPAARPEQHTRGGGGQRDEREIARKRGIAGVLDARDGIAAD